MCSVGDVDAPGRDTTHAATARQIRSVLGRIYQILLPLVILMILMTSNAQAFVFVAAFVVDS